MIRMQWIVRLAILLLVSDQTLGQSHSDQKLVAGAQCPPITFPVMLRYKNSTASLADFRGKLVILHFWTTYCGPCIAAFPRLDSLQRKYGDNIQIILVGYESEARIRRVLGEIEALHKSFILPVAVVDSGWFADHLLSDGGFGDYWINKDGRVLGEALPETDSTVNALLHGDSALRQPIRRDSVFPGAAKSKLLTGVRAAGAEMNLRYDVSVSNYDASKPDRSYSITTDRVGRYQLSLNNHSILSLCQFAFGKIVSGSLTNSTARLIQIDPYPRFLTRLNFPDSGDYCVIPKDGNRYTQHAYSCNAISGVAGPQQLLDMVKDNLAECFGINVRIETIVSRCFVLKRTAQKQSLRSKGGDAYFEKDNFGIRIVNEPVSELITALEYYLTSWDYPLIIDETGIAGPIDLAIVADLDRNWQAADKALSKHGLRLVVASRRVKMLVIGVGAKLPPLGVGQQFAGFP